MNTSAPITKRLVSAVLAVVFAWWLGCYFLPMDFQRTLSVLTTIATAAGTLLGFLLTAMTLLTAVMDRTLVSNMRKTGHYQRLIRETFFCCIMLLATLIASVASMFLSNEPLTVLFAITVGLSAYCVVWIVEAGYRFKNLFLHLS